MRLSLAPRSCVMLLMCLAACIEPYDPPVSDEDVRILVVDGFLNGQDGEVIVSLTRTIPVESPGPFPSETGAFVSIEDETGQVGILAETRPGLYQGQIEDVNITGRYRLMIRTGDTDVYTSEYVSLSITPPIDSITYVVTGDGLELRVNTHDPSGQARYFKWEFEETFEYHASFNSIFYFVENEIVTRPFDQSIFTCWRTNPSTDILVASTEHLDESVLSNFLVHYIPQGSIKLSQKYSLLLRQRAMSLEAYNYWLSIQKSTEHVGGLFDPLPAEVSGNIRSTTDPSEKVIGYFSAGTTQEARIFITPRNVPGYVTYNFNPSCLLDTIPLADLTQPPTALGALLVDAVYGEFGEGLIGYSASQKECVDCTMQGGTTTKPVFWK